MTPGFVGYFSEVVMNIIAWILVGLIGGSLAKLLMPGRDPGGLSS